MPKTIRLVNVDYIVTSDNKEIDLNNIQSASSASSVSTSPYKVDGHSPSATNMMTAAGSGGTYSNDTDLRAFSSSATSTANGTLINKRKTLGSGSNGASVIIGGGQSNQMGYGGHGEVSQCDLKSFNSSNSTLAGSLSEYKLNVSATSDGAKVMFGGGRYTYVTTSEIKTFASPTTTGYLHGTLLVGRSSAATASDNDQAIFAGGASSSGAINDIEIKSFNTAAVGVDFGDLIAARNGVTGTSDAVNMMISGGNPYVNELKSFASNAASADWGNLAINRFYAMASSDGEHAYIASGNRNSDSSMVATVDRKSFSSNVIDVSLGNLSTPRQTFIAESGSI